MERVGLNRYFFNFRSGSEIAHDSIGMYLPDVETARAAALDTCRDLAMIAMLNDESELDGELEVADASGEPVFTIPVLCTKH